MEVNNSFYYNCWFVGVIVVFVFEGLKFCLISWLVYYNFFKNIWGWEKKRVEKKVCRGFKKGNLFSWLYIVYNGRCRNVGILLLKRFIINRIKSVEEWERKKEDLRWVVEVIYRIIW